ncbi:MAG TPA: type I restriction enzyme endonuclease domain-containing protein [Vicinamibacterales bacterium]|nr:type I restriction enzyme endonuclease domain-containing protein [Vicinamibacterales bacterium]
MGGEAKHEQLSAQTKDGADPEDPDEYRADNIFWVPREARWQYLKSMAPQATIGQIVDVAMEAIERENPSLEGVLPKDYARPGLDKQRLAQIINLVDDRALAICDDVGFFQAIRAVLTKHAPGERKTDEELNHAIRQIVSNAIVSDEVVDIFAAGLKRPDISILSDEFLAEVRGARDVTIDWTVRQNVRAQFRVYVKRILRKYGYPPDKQEKATGTVLEQAEVLSAGWAIA